MPEQPDYCECGSYLFTNIYAVSKDDGDGYKYSPASGESRVTPVGWKCVECGRLQLTEEIPQPHADNDTLDLPESADRDMVQD